MEIKVKLLPNFKGELPKYESEGASGMDVRAQIDGYVHIYPKKAAIIPTGLSFEIPKGFEIQVRSRSGLAAKNNVFVLNSPGTIDSDYRGEVKVILYNAGDTIFSVKDQDRIAQLVVCPVIQAKLSISDSLSETNRGSGGFGSTGK